MPEEYGTHHCIYHMLWYTHTYIQKAETGMHATHTHTHTHTAWHTTRFPGGLSIWLVVLKNKDLDWKNHIITFIDHRWHIARSTTQHITQDMTQWHSDTRHTPLLLTDIWNKHRSWGILLSEQCSSWFAHEVVLVECEHRLYGHFLR